MANPQYVYHMSKLSKTYPGGKQVLKDISLSFFPGAKIGVVGLNGAGKSTLLRTLYRSYLPLSGEIRFHSSHGLIDLARAADVDVAHLRRTE
ncbi:MAG: ATP-binding cassette domain-containing protein, partial [Pseudomonadota bacterium]